MQKQVPQARRNSNIILWHPSGVRPPVPIRNREPGGRSPFTLNDHRLLSANPPGWRKSEFVFARALSRSPNEIRSAERYAAVTRARPSALRPPRLPAVHPKAPPAGAGRISSGAGWNRRCWRVPDAEGVVHTSPGQRPGSNRPKPFRALKARFILLMRQAVGLQQTKECAVDPGRRPACAALRRALPWAGMNQAFGLKASVPTPWLPSGGASTAFRPRIGTMNRAICGRDVRVAGSRFRVGTPLAGGTPAPRPAAKEPSSSLYMGLIHKSSSKPRKAQGPKNSVAGETPAPLPARAYLTHVTL
jgi:hypothetical protein